MADRPILFSGPMVRALLAGTKTQTRRGMFKKDPPSDGRRARFQRGTSKWEWRTKHDNFGGVILPQPRIAVGDRLYVREHWYTWGIFDDLAPSRLTGREGISYIADNGDELRPGRFRQGMHMPRWASRLTLTVTDVKVERLQDISEADAIAEGIERAKDFFGCPCWKDYTDYGDGEPSVCPDDPVGSYHSLWDNINGAGSWDANPWVAAYTFTVQRGNIDAPA